MTAVRKRSCRTSASWPHICFRMGRVLALLSVLQVAVRSEPLCANSSFFDTFQKCFRAGLVVCELLISKATNVDFVISRLVTLDWR